MVSLNFQNTRGDILPLVNNKYFHITNIDGHTSIFTDISSSVIGGIDGDTVNNVQAQPRPIIIDLQIKSGVDVETAKREILKIVKPKQYGSLVWEQNDRTVTISGIVEAVDMPRWNDAVTMQISMYCSQPFWEDIDFIIRQISEAVDLHYFTTAADDMLYFPEEGIALGEYDTIRTKEFHNAGDVSVGLEISIVALDTVTNPIIYDQDGRYFGIGYDNRPFVMQAGENVTITTHKGKKAVVFNGVNLFDKIKPGSSWLQLAAGDNAFTINSDDESISNMSFSLIYKQRYV